MIAHFPDARDLNKKPLNAFKPLFTTLDPPDIHDLVGVYEAAITGPSWLRMGAGPSLALSGLGDWWGKEFTLQGGANLVLREEKFQRKFPFQITIADSAIDGKAAISLRYPADCPFPWPHISEEIREIETGRWLGLTLIDLVGLRRMALPFLLERRENGDILKTQGSGG
jgi:hypothetical protein